jgi:hypothetical protein
MTTYPLDQLKTPPVTGEFLFAYSYNAHRKGDRNVRKQFQPEASRTD